MAKSARGKVSRMNPDKRGCHIRLEGIPADATPKDGYFLLDINHPNYNALYSLVLAAAVNRHPLLIRTVGSIDPAAETYPKVSYLVADW